MVAGFSRILVLPIPRLGLRSVVTYFEIANDCDLKYKVSQNQRLLVELCLMQLASITFDGEKKKLSNL